MKLLKNNMEVFKTREGANASALPIFKSAGDQNQYLVTLLINLDQPNNLSRKVYNRNHAKYRCKQATVLSIRHKDTDEPVNKVRSSSDPDFIYTVGETVTVPDYQSDIDEVCTEGIHFYLTEETARFHDYKPLDGPYKTWFPDGQKWKESNYQNGQLHGLSLVWYTDDQKGEESNFLNGQLHGPYQTWYANGQKCVKSNYKNGQLHGPAQGWYKNGQKHGQSNYLNDKRHGPFQIWYNNGQKWEESNYQNGQLHGSYQSWHPNGQKWKESNYQNGQLHGLYQTWYENGQISEESNYLNGQRL